MATHHSKTGRAKSPNDKIVVPSWDEVWDSFNKENTTITVESMNSEGWRTVEQVMKSVGLSSSRIYKMIQEGLFDREKKKVKCSSGCARFVTFIRPKC